MKKISIILLLILCIGCRSTKTVQKSEQTKRDSISYVERIKIDTLKIPGETIQIELPCDQLRPQSAAKGRAKVKVEPQGNSYIVTASCDSIEKIIISKEIEINRLSELLKSSISEKTNELTFMQNLWIVSGKILWVLLVLWLVIKIVLKWKKPL